MANTRLVVPEATVPGTHAWTQALVSVARRYASYAEEDTRPLVSNYRELCEHRAWETWFADEPRTLARFCQEALGQDAEFLEAMSTGVAILDRAGFSGPVSVEAALTAARLQVLARESREAALTAADDVPLPGRGGDRRSATYQNDNIIQKEQGTSESYLRRRLKRDHPALYERVRNRELSASAAAIEAGIQHRTVSVRVDDPERAARTLRDHLSGDDLETLIQKLRERD